MLWILGCLFFCWLIVREISGAMRAHYPEPIYVPYLVLVTVLAGACAWPPLRTWQLERFLAGVATQLADGRRATVHCNTVFDTMLSQHQLAIGYAEFETGRISIQKPWCGILRDYLSHPERASRDEIMSLGMITHEAMHVGGELDEAKAECKAVQRNYRSARLLGVPDAVAKVSARRYYDELYADRGRFGGVFWYYHSNECAPGKALDEQLSDSTWKVR